MSIYDIVIVGAGPAGLSAAITARARNKSVVVISNKPEDSPLAKSHLVDNYPGLPSISGATLLEVILKQACNSGAEVVFSRVISVLPFGNSFMISHSSSQTLEARSVIIATGTTNASNTIKGEHEYLGKGVSYCATCDGMFFRQATVVVAGLNSEAPEEANFLQEIGATVNYVAPRLTPELISKLNKDIAVYEGKISCIQGDDTGVQQVSVTKMSIANATTVNTSTNTSASDSESKTACDEPIIIPAKGVFVLRPQIAPMALLATLKVHEGYIDVDKHMHTSVPGVFAAGDCVGKPLQIAKAVGEGQIASLSAVEYLIYLSREKS